MKDILDLKYIVICILLILTAFSYHPSFSNVVTEGQGDNPLSRYINILAILAFVLCFSYKDIIKESVIRKYFQYWLGVLFFAFVVSLINSNTDYPTEAKNILMAFVFLIIGFCSKLDRQKVTLLVFVYSAAAIYCTFHQIMYNFGGFVIADLYMKYGKNTLGVMTASSSISCLLIAFYEERKLYKIIGYTLFGTLLLFTITIRARAAFLTIFLVSGYILFKWMKGHSEKKNWVILGFLAMIIGGIAVFPNLAARAFDYFFSSFTQNQGTDLTSDRLNRNSTALHIIGENPFFGNLALNLKYDWVHNYFLRQLSSYGIVFSIPILAHYFFIIKNVAIKVLRHTLVLNSIGFYAMIVPLVISLEEPTFPYAPGTGTVLPFLLFGYSLFQANQEDLNHYQV